MWLSVDPLAEKFPSHSPYSFCFNNPLRFVDPDGRAPSDWINLGSRYFFDPKVKSQTEAVASYGFGAVHMPEGSTLNGRGNNNYQYTFHNDATVTDVLGLQLNNTKDFTTSGGSTIEASECFKGIMDSSNQVIGDASNYGGILQTFGQYGHSKAFNLLTTNIDGTYDLGRLTSNVKWAKRISTTGTVLNYASYFGSLNDAYNGEYKSAVVGGVHNYIGIKVSSTGVLPAAGWFIGTSIGQSLSETELYNSVLFGKNSHTYKSRIHNWTESKILEK